MNLIDLPTNVPWLSLIWLSLVAPTLLARVFLP
jgi:NADH-quinone oxidoreductase subunit M